VFSRFDYAIIAFKLCFSVMLCPQAIKFYAHTQYKAVPLCHLGEGEAASTINTGRKFFDVIGCGFVGAIAIKKEEDRGTLVGTAPERFTAVISGLSLPFEELKALGQIFVFAPANKRAEEINGQIERLRQYGAFVHMLIDPSKPCPIKVLEGR
jgi:hypothetical protein